MTSKEILDHILEYSALQGHSDIHFNTGLQPKARDKNGEIVNLDSIEIMDNKKELPIFTKDIIGGIIECMVGKSGLNKFQENMELDSSYTIAGGSRYRVNCYMDTKGYSIALRLIPSEIPTMESLELSDTVKGMCEKSKGLILVTGPTGSGKSTNLAAMIDYINKKYKKHIITIEDPVEFAFDNQNSLINQREISNHTKGFPEAIRAALREDPDVIMVGEMRDPETIKAAITLAETGHLVLSTLHTNDSVQTIDRIVDVFPSDQQAQIRMQLAMSLVGVLSQRLITKADKNGKIAAREILMSTDAVRNLIITGKTHQLYSVLEVGANSGMILMDKYLLELYSKGLITKESLLSYARDKDSIEMMIN
ncbi:type IV pilus twitching motility protein PilT [Candidatus Gracilibacteria bacterium 28_42_T64]|nr:type IV pilus twitching motility protein PilT [Candidatus Gracilibacteria bacterium 28_42_T64]